MSVKTLPPQLLLLKSELKEAQQRAHHVAGLVTDAVWTERPSADRWSVAECLVHLDLTSQAYLPLIKAAIATGRELGLVGNGPYRTDLVGWLLCRGAEPPVRLRIKTTADFAPATVGSKEVVLAEFDGLQAGLISCLHDATGLDLGQLKITSPFVLRIRYNLYSCLKLLPAHQRRHLWQAEQVVRSLQGRLGGDLTREFRTWTRTS